MVRVFNLRFSKSFESVSGNPRAVIVFSWSPFNDNHVSGSIYCIGNGGKLFPGFVVLAAKPKIYCEQFQFRHAMDLIFDQLMTLPALSHRKETC
jgi:hypothetical protein